MTISTINLKNDVLNLLYEIDKDIFHTSKILEKRYLTELGSTEYESFLLQYQLLRQKRKYEIIKDLLDNNRFLDLEFVEKILDVDFEEHLTLVKARADLLSEALAAPEPLMLTKLEEQELADLYKTLLDYFHPTFNPSLSTIQNEQFLTGVTAFINKDIQGLKSLVQTLPPKTSLEDNQQENLTVAWADLIKQKETLYKAFPFSNLELLNDHVLLKNRLDDFNQQITYYKKYLHQYDSMLEQLLNDQQKK